MNPDIISLDQMSASVPKDRVELRPGNVSTLGRWTVIRLAVNYSGTVRILGSIAEDKCDNLNGLIC